MKRKLVMLLTAAMLTATVSPAIPAMTATVYAAGSASSEIFRILTEDGGLSSAAACGIIGNLEQESGLNPEASGSFYGLVQWDSRRTANLKAYCSANGYSSSSISGQVHFLLHELENGYSGVLGELQSVPDTADGAVSAAKAFCRGFEQCGNYDWEFATRGSFASTYFSMYGGSSSSDDLGDSDEETSSDSSQAVSGSSSDGAEQASSSENSESSDEESSADSEASDSSAEADEESSDSEEADNETTDEDTADDTDPESSDEETADEESSEETDEETSDENSDEETSDSGSSDHDAYSDSDFQYLLGLDYDVSLIFDYDYYTSRYPDVVDSVGSDYDAVLHHFLTYGVEHGQRGSLSFSVVNYQNNNPDLVDQYADEYVKYYVEYVKSGHDEGRDGSVSDEQNDAEQKRAAEEAEWQGDLDSIGMTQEEYNEYIAEKNASGDDSSDEDASGDSSQEDDSPDENTSATDDSED